MYLVFSDDDKLKAVFTNNRELKIFVSKYEKRKMLPCYVEEYRTKENILPINTEVFLK